MTIKQIVRLLKTKNVISTADVRRWTQMHRAASNAVGKALYPEAGLSESQQQAEPRAGCLQVVDALGSVSAVQRLDRFQFDDDGSLDQQIDHVLRHDNAVVVNHNPLLLRDGKTGLAQLVGQRATSDVLRQPIGRGFNCVHLRLKFLTVPHAVPASRAADQLRAPGLRQ